MLKNVPEGYDETYKWYTRRGSRVLALGFKEMDSMTVDKVRTPVNVPTCYSVLLLADQQAPA